MSCWKQTKLVPPLVRLITQIKASNHQIRLDFNLITADLGWIELESRILETNQKLAKPFNDIRLLVFDLGKSQYIAFWIFLMTVDLWCLLNIIRTDMNRYRFWSKNSNLIASRTLDQKCWLERIICTGNKPKKISNSSFFRITQKSTVMIEYSGWLLAIY